MAGEDSTRAGHAGGPSPRPVVVAYDGRESSRDALELGALLARTLQAPLTLAHVGERERWPAPRHDAGRGASDPLATAPVEPLEGLTVQRRTILARSVPVGLAGLLEELDARTVVVGSTNRGPIGRLVPGSTADQLLARAPCGIAVAPRGYRASSVRVIAVGFDDSPESRSALALATECAEHAQGTIRVFAVASARSTAPASWSGPAAGAGTIEAYLEERLRDAVDGLKPELRAARALLKGDPGTVLIEEADRGVDLMYLGSRGWGPLRRALTHSVSSIVSHAADCPVVIVPPGARQAVAETPPLDTEARSPGSEEPRTGPPFLGAGPDSAPPSRAMFEVRIHGRGGQGVVTAAELLSVAAFLDGRHAQAFPSFGSERTGAPVVAFCRVGDREIRTREPIATPDAVIVQDPTLLHQVDVFGGLRPDGYILINSARSFEELGLDEFVSAFPGEHVVTVPATEIAREHLGRPLPNVPLLGGFAALSGAVSIDSIAAAIRDRFSGTVAEGNLAAAEAAFKTVRTNVEELVRA